MAEPTLLQEVTALIRGDLAQPRALWQLAVIAIGCVTGYAVSRWLRVRHEAAARAAGTLPAGLRSDMKRFSMGSLRRLAFPVTAFAVILAGTIALRLAGLAQGAGGIQLLRLAMTLLAAMAAIRLIIYILRRALRDATWLVMAERWIAALVWVAVALHVMGLMGDVKASMEAVSLPVGRSQITLLDLLAGAISVAITVLGALWLSSVIESRVMGARNLTPNSRVVLVRFIKAVLMVVAVLIALSSAGIDLTVLSVFGGALGVGLGLGLQRIASNYVSGFIILIERSLSIGDMITIEPHYGKVVRINTRYTVLNSLNGTEIIVPNEMLVANPVINHSLSSPNVRIGLKLQVAYDTDVDRALQILTECASRPARVLADPAPSANLTGFGADGLDLEVGFWIMDPDQGSGALRSEVGRAILKAFAAEGIQIPFPQRDVRLVSVPAEMAGLAAGRESKGKS